MKIKYPYYFFENAIPDKICDLIISSAESDSYNFSPGTVLPRDEADIPINDDKIRSVELKSIPIECWISAFFYHYGVLANQLNFFYDVTCLSQVDFLKYTEGMFYRTHVDTSLNSDDQSSKRKLTIIAQLSDSSDYTGGEVYIYDDKGELELLPNKKGTIIVFSSNRLHKVDKILSGTRYAIVAWLSGPEFK